MNENVYAESSTEEIVAGQTAKTETASKANVETIWKLWLGLSVVFMVLCSALQHFLFDWTHCPFFALWCPTCESPAEHTKLMFYPCVLWWLITYFAFRKQININAKSWFLGLCVSSFLAVALLNCFYWVFFAGLNLPSILVLHILFEALAFVIAQVVGYHVYKHSNIKTWVLAVAIVIAVSVAVLMAVFSYFPPNAEMFVDVPY